MALVVNYYPGSFGDTVIAKLSGLPFEIDQFGRTLIDYPCELKQVWFYELGLDDQKLVFYENIEEPLRKTKIIGAHRFNKFDYRVLDQGIKVLSIDPTNALDEVAMRYQQKVLAVYDHHEASRSSLLQQIETKHGNDSKVYYTALKKEITKWVDSNILASDIRLDLNRFINDPEYLNEFTDCYQ